MFCALRLILLTLTMLAAAPASASFVYDFANQPVSRTGTTPATFAYDGNFKRVKTVENPGSGSGAGGETVYSVYSKVGGLLFRYNATNTAKHDDYIRAGGINLLRITGSGASYAESWLLTDQQGSALAAANSSGAVLWRESYRPYGRRARRRAT